MRQASTALAGSFEFQTVARAATVTLEGPTRRAGGPSPLPPLVQLLTWTLPVTQDLICTWEGNGDLELGLAWSASDRGRPAAKAHAEGLDRRVEGA